MKIRNKKNWDIAKIVRDGYKKVKTVGNYARLVLLLSLLIFYVSAARCVELIKEHIKAYKQEEILKFENRQQSVDKLKPISEPYRGIAADKSCES